MASVVIRQHTKIASLDTLLPQALLSSTPIWYKPFSQEDTLAVVSWWWVLMLSSGVWTGTRELVGENQPQLQYLSRFVVFGVDRITFKYDQQPIPVRQ